MQKIAIAGGDTATPINLEKRIRLLMERYEGVEEPKFLDCGCGAGEYVTAFSKLGRESRGGEFLEEKVQQARGAGLGEEKVLQGDVQNLPFDSGNFDVFLFNEVLEHVTDDASMIVEVNRV